MSVKPSRRQDDKASTRMTTVHNISTEQNSVSVPFGSSTFNSIKHGDRIVIDRFDPKKQSKNSTKPNSPAHGVTAAMNRESSPLSREISQDV